MEGEDIHTVAQVLGHKDMRMAARYQHLSPAFLAKAMATLDRAFGVQRDLDVAIPNQLPEGTTASD